MALLDIQVAVRDSVRGFARRHILPRSREFEASRGYPPQLFIELGDLGLMGMLATEAYGGVNGDHVSYALALMELAAADGALASIVSIQNSLIVSAILQKGTDAQKARFLPDLIDGRMLGAFALTESEAGSDASALRTRAARVDGGWCLNGTKQFITSGRIAGVALVFAVTEPGAGKKGISSFLVPTDSPGYLVEGVESKMGQHASDTCTIRLEDLFVADEQVLGSLGEGYRIALANLETGRIGIAAQAVGMAQAALDIAVEYAKQRRSMGKAIIEHQAVGFRLADHVARLEAARQLVLFSARLKDDGVPCLKEASMAKLVASETAEEVCSGAMQTLGGYGYIEDFGLAKIYRDVRVCQIYEGTSDIQRMVIARALQSE